MESERRTFLKGLAAIGLYPIGVRAFGPTIQITPPIKIQKPEPPEKIGKASVKRGKNPANNRNYECVVGDFQMTQNGHLYSREIWEERVFPAISSMKFVLFGTSQTTSLPLNKICGVMTRAWFRGDTVCMSMRVTDTPEGNILQSMLVENEASIYLTPCGEASHVGEDGIIPSDYSLNHFYATPEIAFVSATPLHAPTVPGGELLPYVPTLVKHVQI